MAKYWKESGSAEAKLLYVVSADAEVDEIPEVKEMMLTLKDVEDFLRPRSAMADLRRGGDASALWRKIKDIIAKHERS